MLPSTIDPTLFGPTTFYEDFSNFRASEMQTKPAVPDTWRTVYGNGGPGSVDYRQMSAGSIAVDPTFKGVENGVVGDTALGLVTAVVNAGNYVALQVKKTPAALLSKCFNKPYIGAALTTKFSFSQLFGYFEITAKIPKGKGLWPAFWLLPLTGQWPVNGEIDVIEFVGDTTKVHCTTHSAAILPTKQNGSEISLPFDASAGDHRYGVAWTADEIVWYIDRKEVKRMATPSDMKSVPMYLILNMACGGSWPGYPDETQAFPANFFVRRVSAWQLP